MSALRLSYALTALLSLSSAAVIPSLFRREEIPQDAIRYMKCDGLVTSKPDVGGWERGMAAWWADEAAGGPPAERVLFDMYTAMEDYFYNSHGSVYGGNGEINKSVSMWVDFKDPGVIKPPNNIWVGQVIRKTATQSFGYNCQTEDTFTYEDEKYGTCRNYVTCVQRDALKFYIKGSEDSVGAAELETPKEILARLSERYDADSQSCDPTPLDLNTAGCTVVFECTDNDIGGATLDVLTDTMMHGMGADSSLYKDETRDLPVVCGTDSCTLPDPSTYLYRTVPKVIQMKARAIPQSEVRKGYEVAHLTATVECKDKNKDALCDALGVMFDLIALAPKVGPVGDIGGIITEVGCGIVTGTDDD